MTRRELLAIPLAAAIQGAPRLRTVFIEMAGGPSHCDLFDLQPGAWTPPWIRPVRFGDVLFPAGLMPRLAELPDRITLVRGLEAVSLEHHSIVAEGSGPLLRAATATFAEACAHALGLLRQGEAFVHIRYGSWDHHGNLYQRLRPMALAFDQGVARLIGSSEEGTKIVAMGEFGRKPGPLNQNGGRDHHRVHAALVAEASS